MVIVALYISIGFMSAAGSVYMRREGPSKIADRVGKFFAKQNGHR